MSEVIALRVGYVCSRWKNWNTELHPDFSEVVCEAGGQKILVGDLKTLQPTMSSREQEMMRKFSPKFSEVGWLNDKVRL